VLFCIHLTNFHAQAGFYLGRRTTKLKTQIMIVMATAASLLAQRPGPHSAPSLDALKTYLNLTDSQVQGLQQIQQQERQANQTTMQTIRQNQANLDSMMQKGGADAATVGKLMVDIQTLQGSVSKTHDSFSAQAANTLTADQKTKLKTLQDAMALMPAIHQASALGLLTSPQGAAGTGATTLFRRGPGGPRWHGPPPSNPSN
jgi:Spy/CpxP family protein refolding chaperone